jgi:hypothetical protein
MMKAARPDVSYSIAKRASTQKSAHSPADAADLPGMHGFIAVFLHFLLLFNMPFNYIA